MFPYDKALSTATKTAAQSIADVLSTMRTINDTCVDGDGLKWFNWLYLEVTQEVENRVGAESFADAGWLTALDIQFATLYFSALNAYLNGVACPGCWSAMFDLRDQTAMARIQFALAGMNAHINHDLPLAIVSTCKSTGTIPAHQTPQYLDYTSLNPTMNGLIEQSKKTLNVRLLGADLPSVSHVEDTIAAWDLATAREAAWDTAENLWKDSPPLADAQLATIDGLTKVISKALLVPAPFPGEG